MRSSKRTSLLAALLGLGLVLPACTEKPSEADCDEFAKHLVKLLEESRDKPDPRIRKLAHNQHQALVDTCVKDGDKKKIECVLAQSSLADVQANCK